MIHTVDVFYEMVTASVNLLFSFREDQFIVRRLVDT